LGLHRARRDVPWGKKMRTGVRIARKGWHKAVDDKKTIPELHGEGRGVNLRD